MPDYVFAFMLTVAGLLGLVIGSFLNVVVSRVPARIPLTRESRCPHCGARVRWWQNMPVISWVILRGRCASCAAHISVRYPLVELATGIAFVGVTWLVLGRSMTETTGAGPTAGTGATWSAALVLIALLYFAAVSIVLTLIDLDTHRLPNSIVLPAYPIALLLVASASVLSGDVDAFVRALVGMAALYAFYFLLRLIRPGGMGGGDVKLAGVVGLYLGWTGWGALLVGAFAAFLLGGIVSLCLLATRRASGSTAIPFGPWMILGCWVGIVAGEAMSDAYLGLITGTR